MRVVLQRTRQASVSVDGEEIGRIASGLLLLVGFRDGDSSSQLDWMADKVAGLRVFSDDSGKMNLSVNDVGGAVLIVSQFTLYGDCSKGRRPSFVDAAHPDVAVPLYESFIKAMRERVPMVETGQFGAMMDVDFINDGPVTLILER